MSNEQQLINDYLSSGGTIKKFSEAEEVIEPYQGKKKTTEPSMEFDSNGRRVYRYLNKTDIDATIDETGFNYGN